MKWSRFRRHTLNYLAINCISLSHVSDIRFDALPTYILTFCWMAIIIIIMFGFYETVVIKLHRLVHWPNGIGDIIDECTRRTYAVIISDVVFIFLSFLMDSISKGIILISSLWFGWCIWAMWDEQHTSTKMGSQPKNPQTMNMIWKIKPQNDDNHQQCARFWIQHRYGYCFKIYANGHNH